MSIKENGVLYQHTMYSRNKGGSPVVWSISVVELGGKGLIKVSSGLVGGALISHDREIKVGKNLGKVNQTTPQQQAVQEAMSRVEKQKLRGYRDTLEEHDAASVDRLSPMLAHTYDKHKKKVSFPCFVQPKLNGVRCLAEKVDDSTIVFHSRGGKTYDALNKHHAMVTTLLEVMNTGEVLDGEVYIHGTPLQKIVDYVKDYCPKTTRLSFYIYDVVDSVKPFKERVQRLFTLSGVNNLTGACVHTVVTSSVMDHHGIEQANNEFLTQGYEGVMIRNRDGLYEIGKRSHNLLKLKDFKESEFKIVGATHDVDECVIWLCKVPNKWADPTFFVVPLGSKADRRKQWFNASDYYGKMLTVRYSDVSVDGKPIGNPVGVAIRDYE